MAQSLTDLIQKSRLTVVSVDKSAGRLRVRDDSEMCTDLTCQGSLVVTEEESRADLGLINPGDIIKVELNAGRPEKIVVVRRAWEEYASPET
ncbi:MAG: hypothetical protein HYY64_05635 [Candidatus Rokubacteria bacterium]|nr:hypothetical protein [Candidatus Rokubacteria bacterium]